jgi:hypothetical protein
MFHLYPHNKSPHTPMKSGKQSHPLWIADHNRNKYMFAGNLMLTVQLAPQHLNNSNSIISIHNIYKMLFFTK